MCWLLTFASAVDFDRRFGLGPQKTHYAVPNASSPPPQWNDDATIAHIRLTLSLCSAASCSAVLFSMLGSRWLDNYTQEDWRGSVVDHVRQQQAKMDALVTWNFDLVMDIPLFFSMPAFALLGYARSSCLYLAGEGDAGFAVGVVTFIFSLVYLLITLAATLSYGFPFQNPHSLALRSLVRFGKDPKKYLRRIREWFGPILSKEKNRQGPNAGGPRGFPIPNEEKDDDQFILSVAHRPSPLFDEEISWDSHVLDSNSITWMFGRRLDANAKMVLFRFIIEVVWHAGIRTTPLLAIYRSMILCFDQSYGRCAEVVPELMDQAYLSSTALLHVAIQRKCVGDESDTAVFKSISSKLPIMRPKDCRDGSDLEATLVMIDCLFGIPKPIHWQNFSLTVPHHAWMAHILLYRAWDAVRKGEPLPDNIEDFAFHSLRLEPPSPMIVADCLLILGLTLGITLSTTDLSVVDKE